jgi:hypothetical protein
MTMRLSLVSLGFLALLALASVQLAAQAVTVDYVEGSAAQRTTAAWAVLSIGDTIPLDGSVKVDDHSLVQLKAPGAAITLSRPGTYIIRKLLAARASLRAAGAAQALAVAFSRVLHGSEERLDEAGGVRAEQMPPGEGFDFGSTRTPGSAMREDSVGQEYIDSGKRYIASGEYQDAIDTLLAAVGRISPGDTREARFYLATAYSLSGDMRLALRMIPGDAPERTEEWAPDLILLRAKLLEDTFAFTEATELLVKQGASLAADEARAPTYFFLLALAYRGNGDAVRQNLCLDKVVSLAAESELGATAAKLRGQGLP